MVGFIFFFVKIPFLFFRHVPENAERVPPIGRFLGIEGGLVKKSELKVAWSSESFLFTPSLCIHLPAQSHGAVSGVASFLGNRSSYSISLFLYRVYGPLQKAPWKI